MSIDLNPPKEQLAVLGRALVGQLFVLLKTSQNYSEGHAALDAPVAGVLKVVRDILATREEAVLSVRGADLYLAGLRLRSDAAGYQALRFVLEEMRRHLVGAISFNLAVSPEEIRRFAYALREVDAVPSADTYGALLQRMQQRMISTIEVETLAEEGDAGRGSERPELTLRFSVSKAGNGRLKARALYQKALEAMEEAMSHARGGMPLRLREPKRIVQRMIDLLATQEATLLGLTSLRRRVPHPENHAVNVCILSLVLGKRLGLSKFQLSELGLAALLHDLGKADLPPEMLEQPGQVATEGRELLERHPLYGVRNIMRSKGLDVMTARVITGVFEHHLGADLTGYPRVPYGKLSLLGRIIGIADGYDELTTPPMRGKEPHPPAKALRLMMAEAGKAYDLALLKLFMNCVGIHGVGSLLLLDTRELAVVVQNHPDPALWDHPRVKVIADSQGREVDGEIADLAQPGNQRLILANLDPLPFNLDVSGYLL